MKQALIRFGGAAALVLALWLSLPSLFDSLAINSILAWLPMVLLVSLGQMIVIITGGIDVSVGSILGLSAMVLGLVVSKNLDMPIEQQFLICLGVGTILGSINWLLITTAKIQPLIATIATLAAFRGLAFIAGKGSTVTGSMLPDSLLNSSGQGIQAGDITFSWLLIGSVVIAICVSLGLKFLPWGRAVYAYGSQPQGSFRRGISERKVLFIAYAVCGALSGLAGGFYASRFAIVHPGTAGYGLELTAIAAVVIGGVKLTGGVGRVSGVAMSCLFLAVLNVGLRVAGISADWQLAVYGFVLLAALGMDRKRQLDKERLAA
jgi:rhamnose transport system permease protein